MTKGKKTRWVLLAAAIVCLLLWLFVPQSFCRVSGMEISRISRASIYVQEDVYGGGHVNFLDYQVSTEELEPEVLAELLEILEGKGYRPDIRSLLPWKTSQIHGRNGVRVNIHLFCDDAPIQARYMAMLKPEDVAVSTGSGFEIYHPVDLETLNKLHAFAVKYGKAQ